MSELSEADRQRWFDACDAVTAAQRAFSEENDRYSARDGENAEPFDHAALERLRELTAAETEALKARERVRLKLQSILAH